jgi:hypothetical protein
MFGTATSILSKIGSPGSLRQSSSFSATPAKPGRVPDQPRRRQSQHVPARIVRCKASLLSGNAPSSRSEHIRTIGSWLLPIPNCVLDSGPDWTATERYDACQKPVEAERNDEPVGMANVATIGVVGNGVSVRSVILDRQQPD